jgi:hypothetical protein
VQFNVSIFVPVLHQSLALVKLAPAAFAVAVLALFASGIAYDAMIDLRPDSFAGPAVLNMMVAVLAEIFVTRAIAKAAGWSIADVRRYPVMSMLGQSLVMSAGILAGLLLLVLPGLFLAARWFIAAQIVILEERNAMDALHESWERTEEHWAAIALFIIIGSMGTIVPLSLLVIFNDFNDIEIDLGSMASITIIGIFAAVQAMSFVIATVLWRVLTHDENEASRIFG